VSSAADVVYAATGVNKSFGATRALVDATFEMRRAEVHAIVGENGAGKSTLAGILSGTRQPDVGELTLDGKRVVFRSRLEASRAGVSIVAQELQLFPDLTIAQNIFLQRESRTAFITRTKSMIDASREVLDQVGLDVDPRWTVSRITLPQQQLVAIARALLYHPQVLILDEPTSALQATETARLLDIIRGLRSSGVAISYVSHVLEDVLAIADRVTVLRDGRVAANGIPRSELTIKSLVDYLVGPESELAHSPIAREPMTVRPDASRPSLSIRDLNAPPVLRSVSLEVRCGEIVGLAGLEGSGTSALLDVLFGLVHAQNGKITLPHGGRGPTSPHQAVRSGIARVPADRQAEGIMPDATIAQNVTCVSLGVLGQEGFVPRKAKIFDRTRLRMAETAVKAGGPTVTTDSLSGGNQQKLVFAKWIDAGPAVILLDDPTRGVDVGARRDMHNIIRQLANVGSAILMTSSDLHELVTVCDRIAVMRSGTVVRVLQTNDASTRILLELINRDDAITEGRDHGDTG
jgi:ABC-type sugar transport system ATPase subunit